MTGFEDVDGQLERMLAWGNPGLPDPRPDPYERWLTVEQVTEFALPSADTAGARPSLRSASMLA